MSITTIFPSLILLISSYEDIKTRKVKNRTVVILLLISLVYSFFFFKSENLQQGLFGVGTAFLFLLPLYLAKAMGAGDIKISMLLGFFIGPFDLLNTLIYALIFGFLLGFFQLILQKKLNIFFRNIIRILSFKKVEQTNLSQIPFTVSLFLGWTAHLLTSKTDGFL